MPVPGAFGPHVPVVRSLGRTAEQRAWLAALPGLVADLERRWGVRTGRPYPTGTSSWVAPALTADGRALVLKVAWPHREARGEAAALRRWAGDGAPLLVAADEDRFALLMERCLPGTALADASLPAEHALVAAGEVLAALWQVDPAGVPLETVEAVCAEWAALVRQRLDRFRPALDTGLVRRGADLLTSLPASAARRVVVHGDANPTNVLAAGRRPWLFVDAKPMLGDPAYDPAPLLLQVADPGQGPVAGAAAGPVLARRAALLGAVAGEPAERLLAWALARSVEAALWCVAEDRPADAGAAMAAAAASAAALGA